MIKTQKYLLIVTLMVAFTFTALAQSTINSPYSKFGLGNLTGTYMPQNKGMGNLSSAVSYFGGYSNINSNNPASYSKIRLTTFDIGVGSNIQTLKKGSDSENSFNAMLKHLVIAVPVNKKSAVSFGLIPYSNFGYTFTTPGKVEDINVDYFYNGEGGVSKAYLGYGFGLGKNLNLGFNMSYLFGSLKESRSAQYQDVASFYNSRTENRNGIGGLTLDLGLQYIAALSSKTSLTIGYNTSLKSSLNTNTTNSTFTYITNISTGDEFKIDTISSVLDREGKINLPASHTLGISLMKENKWLIGADFRMSNWSNYRINGNNPNLNNTWGVSVGGVIVPNINAVTNYLKLMDYRFGVNYDKSYVKINNNEIDVKSINVGLGLPLVSNRSAFYKINVSGEIGTRGTLDNNLIKENFYNINLGFTINDRWFQKYKYD
ncbi:hypothetical protein PBAC_07000 [Pedobacter glucosidilyticus]|nr:hypothetical protein [Pedobacter glucosidilyticus]KHJ39100.1 hypothetical protein PBAC_07000 [Pedobacter glucosidilyticus]